MEFHIKPWAKDIVIPNKNENLKSCTYANKLMSTERKLIQTE